MKSDPLRVPFKIPNVLLKEGKAQSERHYILKYITLLYIVPYL